MLGEKQRHEPMFYYVRMEDMVPENHLLRLVDQYIDLGFIRAKVKHLYSHTGRPSIDPEVLLRMLHSQRTGMRGFQRTRYFRRYLMRL